MDASFLQGIAAIGGMLIAAFALIGAWMHWQVGMMRADLRDLRADMNGHISDLRADMDRTNRELREDMNRSIRELREDMDRNNRELRADMDRKFQDMGDRMDRNHGELVTLLQGHTHADGSPPVFRRLPDAAEE